MKQPLKHQVQILALLASGPRSKREIAKAVGLSTGTTGEWLRAIRDAGLIGPSKPGGGAVWALAEQARAMQEAHAANRTDTRERKAAYYQRQKAAAALQAESDCCWLYPVKRVVPAACAPRIRTRAVISVFHLGQVA